MILLDTCTLLWLVTDQTSLSGPARAAIAKSAGSIYISSISAFEIAIKAKKKKLILPLPALEWFKLALSLHGLSEIPIQAEILGQSVALPPHHHDPADRIIIATAQLNGLTLVTPDQHIAHYEGLRIVW